MILRGGTIITNNPRRDILFDRSLRVSGSSIDAILTPDFRDAYPADEIIDVTGLVIIPGFIQTHLHLCQTLFRGLADDLQLLDWLRLRIFPFEAAHNERSMHASAMLGIAELVRSGTTTILDMGSIHFQEEIIRAVGESGLRAHVGKSMMDLNQSYPKLKESTKESLSSTRALAERWHGSYDGRIHYAPAPRFALSCSEELMRSAGEMIRSSPGMIMHTHASENREEIHSVRQRFGAENIEVLHRFELLSPRSCLAHCVHLSDHEIELLQSTQSNVTHCPSSNLKLASGIADVPALLGRGVNVSLGADGAPCNNSLDMFHEMRLVALIQKPKHGAESMPAQEVFEMATLRGAKALGLEKEIGSIEIGKKADIVLLDLHNVWNPVGKDLISSIVYSSGPENVDSVMIDGKWVYRKGEYPGIDKERVFVEGRGELDKLLARVG